MKVKPEYTRVTLTCGGVTPEELELLLEELEVEEVELEELELLLEELEVEEVELEELELLLDEEELEELVPDEELLLEEELELELDELLLEVLLSPAQVGATKLPS